MVKRKSRSPKEILSFFNDIIHPKKDDGESATDSLSILNAIQTQEKNGVQERLDAHRPEQSDYAPEQPAVPRPETSGEVINNCEGSAEEIKNGQT